jgi:hypothetical protein
MMPLREARMHRVTAHPIVMQFLIWAGSVLLLLSYYLFAGGGFGQLIENINDIFLIRPPGF